MTTKCHLVAWTRFRKRKNDFRKYGENLNKVWTSVNDNALVH